MGKRLRNKIKRKKQKRHHSLDRKRYRNSRRGMSPSNLKRAKKGKSPSRKYRVKKKIGSSGKKISEQPPLYQNKSEIPTCRKTNKVVKIESSVPENRKQNIGMTKEDGIKQVYGGDGHVVILGAGASIASSLKSPEKNGKKLPSMNNFIEIVGLQDIVDKAPDNLKATNFEEFYSNLHNDNPDSEFIKEIEKRVFEYFSLMELPDEPTIYDYLVLSLRSKDAIATFNWDPFLYQAWCRCRKFTNDLPPIFFLHGNVSIGWDSTGKRFGPAGMLNPQNKQEFVASKLLYPITQKNYQKDEFIKTQWKYLQDHLSPEYKAVRATIFGFGAPATDVEAVKLLNDAWGTGDKRIMEQFEIIDISPEDELRDKWDKFICGTHYDIARSYFDSSLAWNPRRTSEAFSVYQPITPSEAFRESNPIPQDFKTMDDLWQWHKPLIEAEETKRKKQ